MNKSAKEPKIALVYDRVNKIGGAEKVLQALHSIYSDAPLFTAVYDAEGALWAKEFDVRTSFLQKFPFIRKHHEFFPWLMPLAFESFRFDDFDIVISVTSAEAKSIICPSHVLHICYCLTPTRYLWSGYFKYKNSFSNNIAGKLTKFFFVLLSPALRRFDYISAQRPDVFIGISDTVKRRIEKYYTRKSFMIYPPVNTEKSKSPGVNQAEDFFLTVGRLVPYKSFDIIINAFNKLDLPLVVVGAGSEFKRLKSISKANIKFLGQLTEEKLVSYYQKCRAFVYAGEEDFGIVAGEALVYGKPVICFGQGGCSEIVKNGKTGIFFYEQTEESLTGAIKKFLKLTFDGNLCRQSSEKFSVQRFKKEFSQQVNQVYKEFKQER